jgi:hypothetical protein
VELLRREGLALGGGGGGLGGSPDHGRIQKMVHGSRWEGRGRTGARRSLQVGARGGRSHEGARGLRKRERDRNTNS